MNYRSIISHASSRKALCIMLVLIISLSLLAGGALADKCRGGVGCINCADSKHPRLPGMEMDLDMMASHSCQPLIPDGSCSFEVSPGLNEFDGIIPSARPENIDTGSSFYSVFIDYLGQTVGTFRSQINHFSASRAAPIFLINQSQLC